MKGPLNIAQNLTVQPTPFVGRWEELSRMTELLSDPVCRLITLVGPGGIGKTRLGLEALSLLADNFSDGVYFADLQQLTSPALLPSVLTAAVQLQRFPDREPKDQLRDFLRDKSLLIMLDNFEHLLDGALFVSEMLAHAPGLKLIVTSRERLQILEEWVVEVHGLSFPSGSELTRVEDYSAVQLFVQNARRINPDFVLADEAAAVARICMLVDGTPLALELASSWVYTLTGSEIAEELERGLDILETSARNIPERHRSMRAVMDYSWSLLTKEQRDVFMRLATFRGGFRREAGEQITGATRSTLAGLVDKSWLHHESSGRYDTHRLLRQYGEEQLGLAGEVQIIRNAHSAYYAAFIHTRVEDLKGRRQLEALAEMSADFENVRAAWNWASAQKQAGLIDRMVDGIQVFCELRDRLQEAEEMMRNASEQFAGEPAAERVWGRLFARGAGGESLPSQLEYVLRIACKHNDLAEAAFCIRRLGDDAYAKQEFAKAKGMFEQSLAIYRQLGDRYCMAVVQYAFLRIPYGDQWGEFQRYGEESLRLRREIGDKIGTAWSLFPSTVVAARAGHFDKAEQLMQERIALGQEVGAPALVALSHAHLGYLVYFMQGDFARSRAAAEQAHIFAVKTGSSAAAGWSLATLGLLACMDEQYHESRELCRQAAVASSLTHIADLAAWGTSMAACGLGDFEALSAFMPLALRYCVGVFRPVGTLCCLPIAAMHLAHRGNLIRPVELLALAFTHPVRASGWMERWALLTRLRAELEQMLGPDLYAATWERGKLLDVETVARDMIGEYAQTTSSSDEHSENPFKGRLTEREIEVLRLAADGLHNRDIAESLYLSPRTVKWHLSEIYSKLDVRGRVQAIARARDLQLLI